MPTFSVWMLEASNITVSGGGSLGGITQGSGVHLVGRTITLNTAAWRETFVTDNDTQFDDNDTGQRLVAGQTINGVTYGGTPIVEAEYRLRLEDPATGQTYDVIGFNITGPNGVTRPYTRTSGGVTKADEAAQIAAMVNADASGWGVAGSAEFTCVAAGDAVEFNA